MISLYEISRPREDPVDEVIIVEHAFKHGVSAEDIEYAWGNFVRKQYRGKPNEGQVVAVGYDARGRPIELVASEHSFGTVIFHAMTPPTSKMLEELGLVRR